MWLLGLGALQQESHGRLLTVVYGTGYHQGLHSVMIWIVHQFVTVHEDTIYDGCTFGEMTSPLQMFLWNTWEFYFPIFGRKNFEHKLTPVILLLL